MTPEAASADQTLQACQIAPARSGGGADLHDKRPVVVLDGREWTQYTHTQQPNGRVPDCLIPHMIGCFGMATARSRHLGGVNVLMGDGSTRFVNETIDLSVWRSLGTRECAELVD